MTHKNSTLTQEQLKAILHYDPETGVFTWAAKVGKRINIGDKAGSLNQNGYIYIKIHGTSHRAHRLAFLYIEGKFPIDEVDHKSRIKNDNRWCNLKHSTRRENSENMSNNAKFIGVWYEKNCNKWRANSSDKNGKRKYLGRFQTHLAASYCRWAYDRMQGEGIRRGSDIEL